MLLTYEDCVYLIICPWLFRLPLRLNWLRSWVIYSFVDTLWRSAVHSTCLVWSALCNLTQLRSVSTKNRFGRFLFGADRRNTPWFTFAMCLTETWCKSTNTYIPCNYTFSFLFHSRFTCRHTAQTLEIKLWSVNCACCIFLTWVCHECVNCDCGGDCGYEKIKLMQRRKRFGEDRQWFLEVVFR